MIHDVARKQVIVQIDEGLLGDLDREAEARGVNRSELIRRAARAFLDALHDAEDERRMVEAYRRIPEDAAETEAMTRIAAEHWPEW
jgi:metal-responsive CopG/Arc/MetJ family transcriptional regulator